MRWGCQLRGQAHEGRVSQDPGESPPSVWGPAGGQREHRGRPGLGVRGAFGCAGLGLQGLWDVQGLPDVCVSSQPVVQGLGVSVLHASTHCTPVTLPQLPQTSCRTSACLLTPFPLSSLPQCPYPDWQRLRTGSWPASPSPQCPAQALAWKRCLMEVYCIKVDSTCAQSSVQGSPRRSPGIGPADGPCVCVLGA